MLDLEESLAPRKLYPKTSGVSPAVGWGESVCPFFFRVCKPLWFPFPLCQSTEGRGKLPVGEVLTAPTHHACRGFLPQSHEGPSRILGVQSLGRLGRLVLKSDFPEAST